MNVPTLVKAAARGADEAVAKLITAAESEPARTREIDAALKTLPPPASYLIGLTGPPGCGKSTLINGLIRGYRARGRTVGVVAVDPSRPATGGAILGDRIRMSDHVTDPRVFIRSMASRGALGGVAKATATAARILAASGKDVVLVETVGVGQLEVTVRSLVQALAVVLTPASGDEVQFMKAGLMEVADLFILNKSDEMRDPGFLATLRRSVEEQFHGRAWVPPVVPAVALEHQGIADIIKVLDDFQAHTNAKEGHA